MEMEREIQIKTVGMAASQRSKARAEAFAQMGMADQTLTDSPNDGSTLHTGDLPSQSGSRSE